MSKQVQPRSCNETLARDKQDPERCGQYKQGWIINLTTQDSELFSAFDKCYRYLSASECTPECRGALESLSDSLGCCVNNPNTTAEENRAEKVDSFVTDPALWAACGVQTPDFCDLPADTRSVYEEFIQCDTCL